MKGARMFLASATFVAFGVPAYAGTCHVYADGRDTVTACENGSYAIIDRRAAASAITASQMLALNVIRGKRGGRLLSGASGVSLLPALLPQNILLFNLRPGF